MPSQYDSMTVNERLFVAGLLEQFDSAAKTRSKGKMIEILIQVNISPDEAASIADKILAVPSQYGY